MRYRSSGRGQCRCRSWCMKRHSGLPAAAGPLAGRMRGLCSVYLCAANDLTIASRTCGWGSTTFEVKVGEVCRTLLSFAGTTQGSSSAYPQRAWKSQPMDRKAFVAGASDLSWPRKAVAVCGSQESYMGVLVEMVCCMMMQFWSDPLGPQGNKTARDACGCCDGGQVDSLSCSRRF